jgi:hypothetical protein
VSSVLYAEVLGKQGDALSFLLVEIQGGFVFVPSPTLALQLLVESWERMRDGWIADDLAAGTAGGLYCPFPPAEARRRAAASPIAAAGADSADPEWIRENADRYILSTAVEDLRYTRGLRAAPVPRRHYSAPKAQCEFRVRVADAGWLGHLDVGVCWDTTAYPFETG